MNSIQDPSKKTSITSLLNPEASSGAYTSSLAASLNQTPHGQQLDVYGTSFVNGSSFNLRAADWNMADDVSKRKGETGARLYQHMSAQEPYVGSSSAHTPRMGRGRMDEAPHYAIEGGQAAWHPAPPQNPANMPYGAPVVPPLYSDERTAISGDYQSHNNYTQGYQDQPPSAAPQNAWQNAERVSVRLAARGTVQEQTSYYQSYNDGPAYQQMLSGQHPAARQIQPPPAKRMSSDSDEAPPKAKRAKTKGKTPTTEGAPGTSKRGYNAKKRSEAAQIAAQNAQLMPSVSYTQVPNGKGKEKANDDARMQIVSAQGNQQGNSEALHPELQFARCMSNRYKNDQFPRCVSCTRRWAGDTCRFQGIRFFLKDVQRNIVGISFVESHKADLPTMNFPVQWNASLQPEHIKRTKRTVAEALLPTLERELEHLSMPEIIRRPRESEVRATCDTCMTSLFSSSWMCRLCGRETCAECFEQVKDLTIDRPGAGPAEVLALQARREKHAHSNPFFLSCTRRNEHQAKDFSPMSRFCKPELGQAIDQMKRLVKGSSTSPMRPNANPPVQQEPFHNPTALFLQGGPQSWTNVSPIYQQPVPDGIPPSSNDTPYLPPGLTELTLSITSWPIPRYAESALTAETFPAIWSMGRPLVVTNLLSKFAIHWTPEYFIDKYGTQSCLIIECQTEMNKRITVGEFFAGFGKYEDRKECWKLKDWPPSMDFKTAFPELYEDFSKAVPVPNYVRRDGVLNVASHFPSNTVAPDLGPKMYNAMASSQAAGSKGSTRLHMDMADALNIMTFASPCPDGSPGCAAWDLFRAEDSDKIRKFLRNRFAPGNTTAPKNGNASTNGNGSGNGSSNGNASGSANGGNGNNQKMRAPRANEWSGLTDPIHGQQFYLDEELRDALWKEHGVISYRFYQRPGDAVFIPAGCAHQVANMADCIKVAVDFVSPENIERCEKLTREFREQNQKKAWKEDVLQLRNMMWFAWLSCCQQEEDATANTDD
ncbi:hypothetical protein BDZ94DRAFT_1297282 [Collybia nuda]|uniref:JmjC domain-containing protein n=1 Tax=Collybia nuda TaxID=64659 RepID=A0A9P6CFR5_9AGAR|nr:hypothetical protein BDZ94DRAFT_1297282 [Collybia nuda]